MGYVAAGLAEHGQELLASVRGSDVEVSVSPLPFAPHHYHRGD
jgi:aminomethyltransferase